MHTMGSEVSGFIGIMTIQVTILILYGIFVRYDYEMLPIDSKNENITNDELLAIERNQKASYPRKLKIIQGNRKIWCSSKLM